MAPARTLKAISFDLDDTLWPLAEVLVNAESAATSWFESNAPGALDHLSAERRQALRRGALAELSEHDARRVDLHYLRTRVYQLALSAGGHDEALAGTAYDVFHSARNAVEPYPEVCSVLEALRPHFDLVAITNGTAELERVGLARFFRFSVSPRVAGAAKPDARIYHYACKTLGLAPHLVLHAGDDAQLDVAAARAAGLHVAWINRLGEAWPGPGAMPPSFDDLEALCRWLLEY